MGEVCTDEAAPMNVCRWYIAFHKMEHVRRRWLNRLHFWDRYGHVDAFGYAVAANVWIAYEPTLHGTDITAIPHGDEFVRLIDWYTARADILLVDARPQRNVFWRPGFYCVPAVINLTGLKSSAVTPDGLFRDAVRNGAKRAFEDWHGRS